MGSKPTNIFPPSSGCIGTRLNIASETFKMINGTTKMASVGTNLAIIETSKASNKFEAGPAKDIRAESLLGFFKLYGSNSTGFAQPNGIIAGLKNLMTESSKSREVPIGS